MAQSPVQPLEEVYKIVRQEEDLHVAGEERPEVTSFATQTKPRYQSDGNVLCKHCNRSDHSSENCYAVIGLPEWSGDRPNSRSVQGINHGGSSSSNGRRGRGQAYANCVNVPRTDGQSSAHANFVLTDKDRDGVSGLTKQQWKSIKSIHNGNIKTDKEVDKLSGKTSTSLTWILDTGASHHLTGRYDALIDVRKMALVLFIMADGREHVLVKQGSIRLGNNLVMKSVYYVEELKSDLISLGQLMDEKKCILQMADSFLVVQDRISRMVIGAGRRVGGTFHFRSMESVAAVTTKEEKLLELWHCRMGHASAKVVQLLPVVSSSVSVSDLNKACEVSLRAKQTRDCFPISLKKTTAIFELIHVDLWGPYRSPSHSGARYI